MSTKQDRITDRKDYLKADGYEVILKVTYTRARKVRALTPEQAGEFAVAREERFAPKYFRSNHHRHFDLEHVEVLDASMIEDE